MSLSDPEIFKFPVIYMCEPGYWSMSDDDVKNLRAYLLKGGFMIFDDLTGSNALGQPRPADEPGVPRGQLDRARRHEHPIFHSFFEIDASGAAFRSTTIRRRRIFRALFEDNNPNEADDGHRATTTRTSPSSGSGRTRASSRSTRTTRRTRSASTSSCTGSFTERSRRRFRNGDVRGFHDSARPFGWIRPRTSRLPTR